MAKSPLRTYRSTVRAEGQRRTVQRILAAAAELFLTTGYAATTIDAVAARAGVSRRTVFTAVRREVRTAHGGRPQPVQVDLFAEDGEHAVHRPGQRERQAQGVPPVARRDPPAQQRPQPAAHRTP